MRVRYIQKTTFFVVELTDQISCSLRSIIFKTGNARRHSSYHQVFTCGSLLRDRKDVPSRGMSEW